MVEVRGRAETLLTGGQEIMPMFAREVICIFPNRIAGFRIYAGTTGFTVTSRTPDWPVRANRGGNWAQAARGSAMGRSFDYV